MTISNQTFSVAGITVINGNAKVRFANDLIRRIKIFSKDSNATRVELVELPSAMTKVDALKYIATLPEFESASDQATIADTLEDKSKVKGEVKVKVSKAKPSLDSIKARAKQAKVSAEQILAQVADKIL